MADSPTNTTDRPEIPKIGASPEKLRKWVDDGVYYRNRMRAIDWANWRRAELYDGGWQHLKASGTSFDSPGAASQWTRQVANPNDPAYIPLPVLNAGQGVRANESARLARPNYRPKVTAKQDSLEARLGAKDATDMIRHRLMEMEWPHQEQVFYYHIPMYGAWINSEWVLSWDKTTQVPIATAVACANHVPTDPNSCQTVLSDAKVTPQQAGQLGGGENSFQQTKDGLQAKMCPTCPDHPPMLPFKPSLEEANQGKDMLGRSLGETKPIGDWVVTIESPYDMFPRNLGLDMRPGDIPEWVKCKVLNLDALSLLYPQKIKDIKPESPSMLAQVHPVAGSPDFWTGLDNALFKDCVRVKQRHKMPWMELQEDGVTVKMNQGRSVVLAGDTVLMDGPLMIESLNQPGVLIPRVQVDFVPWEFRDGARRLTGLGLWDLMFDVQDGLNDCVSQQQAIRQRLAVPVYVVSRSANLEVSAMGDGVPGRFLEMDIDPIDPDGRPQLMNNETAPPGIADEAEFYDRQISALSGEADVEKGEVPQGVSAALAIQSLKTYASEKRESRLKRIETSLKRTWKHGLELMQGLYIEPRPVKSEDDDNVERWRMLSGLDIKGEMEIEVEAEPDFDEKARDQEQLNSFIGNGIINPQAINPGMRRRIIKIFEGPEALTELDDMQVNAAQREWVKFRDENVIPVIDPSLDDAVVHREEHARSMNTEKFRTLQDRAQWRQRVLPVLNAQWDMLVSQAMSMPAQPMMPDPMGQTTTTMQLDPMTQQPVMAKVPVMVPAGPPQSLQTRIINVWTQELQRNGIPGQVGQTTSTMDAEALGLVLAWYAHTEAHEKAAEMKQQQVQQGQQIAAAPGTPNVAGMAPTTQEVAMQQATPGVVQ